MSHLIDDKIFPLRGCGGLGSPRLIISDPQKVLPYFAHWLAAMLLHMWPCDLDFWPFDLIFTGEWGIVMDYPCAKFGDFSFSRFGFIVWTDRQNRYILTRLPWVWVNVQYKQHLVAEYFQLKVWRWKLELVFVATRERATYSGVTSYGALGHVPLLDSANLWIHLV